MSARARIVVMTIGGALLVIALAATIVLAIRAVSPSGAEVDSRPDPGETVRLYLEAIASGDAETANAMADPLVESMYEWHPDADILTTDAALGASTERISEVEILDVDSSPGLELARVEFGVRLGDFHPSEVLYVRWDENLGVWKLTFPLVTAYVVRFREGMPDGPVTVNGVPVHEIEDGEVQFLAYPGAYVLEYGDGERVDILIEPKTHENLTSIPE